MYEIINILASQKPGNPISTLIPFVIMIVIFWVLIIRPQSKRRKEQLRMVNAMKKGDTAITVGGMHGQVNAVNDSKGTVSLRVAEGCFITFDKTAIATVKTKEQEATEVAESN